jgi:hypothetical protein
MNIGARVRGTPAWTAAPVVSEIFSRADARPSGKRVKRAAESIGQVFAFPGTG